MYNCFFLKPWLLILAVLCIPLTVLSNPAKTDAEKKKTVYEMYERYKRDFPTVKDMTPQKAMKLTTEGRVVFVDVRKAAERKVSKLPYSVTEEEFIKNPSKFANRTIVAYCTISYRSGRFAMDMERKGVRIYNLKGGVLAWVFEGGKVFDEHGQTNRVHVYGEKWNYLPEGYEAVKFGLFDRWF